MSVKVYTRLLRELYDSEDDEKILIETYKVFPKEETVIEISKDSSLPTSFIEIYSYCNGYNVNWEATKIEQAYGNVEFLPLVNVLSSWEDTLYDEDDIKADKSIIHFKPFDQVSPEILCGFIDKPNEEYKSIYLHRMGYSELSSLDLDFEGYITMLCEARAYKNWPYILLYINDQSLDNDLIESFKNDMPLLFSDWTWENFIAKYEELKLSNRK